MPTGSRQEGTSGVSRVSGRTRSVRLHRVEALQSKSRAAWLWALVPAFGLFELGLHVWQVQRALKAEDWDAAVRDLGGLSPQIGIAVSPAWAEPVARRALGPLATFERFGVSDYSHYDMVVELQIDALTATPAPSVWTQLFGARPRSVLPDDWSYSSAGAHTSGRISHILRLNPHPEFMVTDLLALAARGSDEDLSVFRGSPGAELPCTWRSGAPRVEADQDAWGVSRAGHYVQCADETKMSVQVLADHDRRPRRCFFAPTAGFGARTRLVFHKVHFARIARMHDGLHSFQEDPGNHGNDVRVSLSVRGIDDRGAPSELRLGGDTHKDGESWKRFDVDTSAVPAGEEGDLLVDIESDGQPRNFCLEGSTR